MPTPRLHWLTALAQRCGKPTSARTVLALMCRGLLSGPLPAGAEAVRQTASGSWRVLLTENLQRHRSWIKRFVPSHLAISTEELMVTNANDGVTATPSGAR